jgi:cytochrome c553
MITREAIVRSVVKHPWLTAGALTAAVFTGAAAVVISGVMPIKASSGHWAVTAAFLDFAKVRSVATHSWGIKAPPLHDEGLVLSGAGHYENGCFSCHGGPGGSVPPVMAAMTPPPPDLIDTIPRWTPEQLFSIVKHGIKFTGMPAWPVQQRDDEVWAMVAFLRRMPGLDAAAYRRLVSGEASAAPAISSAGERPPPRLVRDLCWRCHGADGTGRGPGAFPSLAGQRSAYVYASLQAFRDGTRFSGIMGEVAGRLDDAAMRAVADYYEGLPARLADGAGDPPAIARGSAIAARGVPQRDIPACAECHGPAEQPKNPAYPRLASQHARYLTSQLRLLKERRRGGSPHVTLMQGFVDRLTDEDIRDVIQYYAALQ